MKELNFPFDSDYILKKRKSLKRELLSSLQQCRYITLNIAILGGSTTHDIREMLELFLMNQGIQPYFYESEYGRYWEDAMFENAELVSFQPDIIIIHTSSRNIMRYPIVSDTEDDINELLDKISDHFMTMWNKLLSVYHCPIIQNNFEQPYYRLMGNREAWDFHGKVNFINRLNSRFYEYAQKQSIFFINDINYMSACYGLQKWADPFYWHMYKYALTVAAIPELAYNLANIVKSIYGKNKKAFVLDLDNTLWGGVVGEDGPENIEIGQETSIGQFYSEFQSYIKEHKHIGIMLAVNSKNDEENALAGLERSDNILGLSDFLKIKANWNAKDQNIREIACELQIGVDSLVFVDDNPAERHIVESQVKGVSVPEIGQIENYIQVLDRSGFFEVTNFSEDDLKRNDMYTAEAERQKEQTNFQDYKSYLLSLNMEAEIKPFSKDYVSRIAQLTNKSNQFNLTTKRLNNSEIEQIALSPQYITLYGKLKDRFGENGVVSVLIGRREDNNLHIELWLMSCRVLKRDMEFAMLDSLILACQEQKITKVRGYYYPTEKNRMVKDFYAIQGFSKLSEDNEGNTIWELDLENGYNIKNSVIKVGK